MPCLSQMKFQETSAKNSTNVDETIEEMMKNIIKKGVMEVKKEKMELRDLNKNKSCRKADNDCC